jgi:hypothetical protein
VLTCIFILSVSLSADAALYNTIGDASGGQVSLTLNSWDDDHILVNNYRVHELVLSVENISAATFPDVKLINPFTWGNIDGLFAYSWVNSSQEWQNSNWSGNDTSTNYLWIKVNNVPLSPSGTASPDSFIQMSQTDIPLTYNFAGVTASVQSTDSLPAWDIDSSLVPGEKVTFSIYFQQERDTTNGLNEFWFEPKVVATPIPTSVLLLTSGLLGLITVRRKFKR